ncbi:MAG: hypothetical protein EBT13_16845 [Rhodobacteraceae bacterium]|nr:hypothetical protein [Paracoccaceae bacterium]
MGDQTPISSIGLPIIALIFAVWLAIFLPLALARKRNRRGWVWVLISLLLSPIAAILLLFALGAAEEDGHRT